MGQLNSARIIGYLPNGMPVREIRGGSVPLPEPPAGGQPPADPDLLGGEPPAPTGQPPAGDPPPAGEQAPSWFAVGLQGLEAKLQAEIDRRIGSITNPRGRGNQQQPPADPPAGTPAPAPAGVDPRDIRDARAVFRDTLRDSGFNLTAGERELVNAVSGGVVQASLARYGDVDQAGEEAARTMSAQLRALRTSHQNDLMARLRAMGAIDESKLRPGQTGQQQGTARGYVPGTTSTPEQFQGGVNRAQGIAAGKGLATPGSTQPNQQ